MDNKIIRRASFLLLALIFAITPIFGDAEKALANMDPTEYVNLLENPSFEILDGNTPVSWGASDRWESGFVTVSSEAARTGIQGVKIETQTSNEYNVRQNVATFIEGGKTYELSAWMKSQIPDHGYAIMKIEFFRDTLNAAGYLGGISSEEFGTHAEWENVNMYVTTPAEANRAQIFLRLYGPGTVFYDDISFQQVDYIPGVNVHPDRLFYYEDMNQGTISGSVGPEDGVIDDKVVDVEIYPEDGGESILSESVPAIADFQYDFDPQMMELRKPYILKVTLRTKQGDVLFEDKETIYRWERPEALREDGTIMVDGEPFFPVIGYHLRVGDYSKVNEVINTVQGIRRKTNLDTLRYHLDEAYENDLKVLFPLYPDMGDLQGPQGIPYVREIISEFKDHPALLGWMIYDEPDLRRIPREDLAEVYREIRTLDSIHPAYMVLVFHDFYEDYFRVTDIASTDTYPLPNSPITRVSRNIDLATGLFPEKPVYALLQAFRMKPSYPYLPNITELRHMAYQSVLNGVQGLGYYSFVDPGWDLLESELYPGILEFSKRELPYFSDFVLNGEQIDAYQDEKIQWGLWEQDDKLYAMAINLTEETQTAAISLPELGYHVETIAPNYGQVTIFENELTIDLSALESTMIQFTPFTSSDEIGVKVEYFKDEGAFAHDAASRALQVHLTAVDLFERQEETSKVVEHMGGFKQLLAHQQVNELISEEAYTALTHDANALIQQKVASLLHMNASVEEARLVAGETLRVKVELENAGEEPIQDPTLNVYWPEAFGLAPELQTIPTLDAGESNTVLLEVEIPDGTAVDNDRITIEVAMSYQGVDMSYTRKKEINVLPLIEVYSVDTASDDPQAIHATAPGEYPISFTLQNNASESLDVILEDESLEGFSFNVGSPVQIEAKQTVEVEGSIKIYEALAEDEYIIPVHAVVEGESKLEFPITVNYTRNLLQNPGFEAEDEDMNPTGWNVRWGQMVQDEVHSGQYAVTLIADRENTWNTIHSRESIQVKPGGTYRLSGWIKFADGEHVDIGLWQQNENHTNVGYMWKAIEGDSDWTYYEEEFVLHEETDNIRVAFLMRGNYEGQAWFDDFKVEDITPPIDARVDTTHIHATAPGDYPVTLTISNNTAERVDVILDHDAPENITLDMDSLVQVGPSQTVELEGNIKISSTAAEDEYTIIIQTLIDGDIIRELPINIHYNRNLLENPGFEETDAQNQAPIGWYLRAGRWVQDEVFSGQYAVTLLPDRNNTWNTLHSGERIPVTPGGTYRLSGWVKLAEGEHVDIGLWQQNENHTNVGYVWRAIEGDSDWAYYEEEFTLHEDTDNVRITFLMRWQYGGQAWFDDFRFEEVIEES